MKDLRIAGIALVAPLFLIAGYFAGISVPLLIFILLGVALIRLLFWKDKDSQRASKKRDN